MEQPAGLQVCESNCSSTELKKDQRKHADKWSQNHHFGRISRKGKSEKFIRNNSTYGKNRCVHKNTQTPRDLSQCAKCESSNNPQFIRLPSKSKRSKMSTQQQRNYHQTSESPTDHQPVEPRQENKHENLEAQKSDSPQPDIETWQCPKTEDSNFPEESCSKQDYIPEIGNKLFKSLTKRRTSLQFSEPSTHQVTEHANEYGSLEVQKSDIQYIPSSFEECQLSNIEDAGFPQESYGEQYISKFAGPQTNNLEFNLETLSNFAYFQQAYGLTSPKLGLWDRPYYTENGLFVNPNFAHMYVSRHPYTLYQSQFLDWWRPYYTSGGLYVNPRAAFL